VSGCGALTDTTLAVPCTAATADTSSTVVLIDMVFAPNCGKVSVGGSITFFDAEDVVHTVTADAHQPEAFDSGPLALDATYQHTFQHAGTYVIGCTLHPGTVTTIFVEP
jgi:plastocyanin